MANAWGRRKGESDDAFDAFQHYLNEGSIDAAYARAKPDQNQIGKRAPAQWFKWSSKYEWVSRASAYADHLAERKRQLWEARREELQERDWQQGDALRNVIAESLKLPYVDPFLRTKTRTERGTPTVVDTDGNVIRQGTPTRTIFTTEMLILDLAKALDIASKLQRLATNEPTENINNLSGAALDALIDKELDRRLAGLTDGSQAGHAPAPDGDETDLDAGAAGGVEAL